MKPDEIHFYGGQILSAEEVAEIYRQGLDDVRSGIYPNDAVSKLHMSADVAQVLQVFLGWNIAIMSKRNETWPHKDNQRVQ